MILTGMKIHAISDTHCKHSHYTMPGGDILVHSGDCTNHGWLEEAINFLNWFEKQDYSYLILVPGNHDWIFETHRALMEAECRTRNITLLNDSGITIEGLNFWGSPVQPRYCDLAFNRDRGEDIRRHWDLIPVDTDILITHGPPAGILDVNPRGQMIGCHDLLQQINKTNVRLHIFGHIHWSRGHMKIGDKLFVNAASLSEQHQTVRGVPFRIKMNKSGIFTICESRKKQS